MIADLIIAEKRIADIMAAEYIGKGYQVWQDAPLHFLPGFRADLLVKKGDERKVIAVKTRPSLVADPAFSEFKRIVNSQPGWKFELLLVGEPERLAPAENSQPLDESGILNRLDQAETALDTGLPEAALLLAWAGTQALVRIMVEAEGIAIKRVTTPDYVLSYAVYLGAIDRDNADRLRQIAECRNSIAHGFEVSDFTGALVVELIAMVKTLLREYHEWIASAGVAETGRVIE